MLNQPCMQEKSTLNFFKMRLKILNCDIMGWQSQLKR